jgi:hypothetical protein
MTAAIFGLIGVVVGALVTGIVQWRLERRRETTNRRAAMRLLAADFAVSQALIRPVLETGAWGSERIPLPLEAYGEYRGVISAELNKAAWKYVEGAVLGLRHLNEIRADAERSGRDFTPAEMDHFRRIGAWLDGTIEKVDAYVE